MLVALQRFDLRIPGCTSLKQKRNVIKGLTVAIRQRFAVSVAEVEHHDLWQRAAIAVAVVGSDQYHLKKVMHEVQKLVDRWAEVEVIDAQMQLVWPED